MTDYRARYGPHNAGETYVAHRFAEQLVDLGEIEMNYATVGDAGSPALLLIPGQTESWWGYEAAMDLLAKHFQVFAVDLRGQGRSTRTPGRYTLDNMGNDLVRFIDVVIGRPTIVSGLSSGGVLAAWLSAYAKPGQVVAALLRGPAAVRVGGATRPYGPGIRQCIGPMFDLWSTYLGDQWSHRRLGRDACRRTRRGCRSGMRCVPDAADEPPQNLKEYDPEWGRAFWTGTVGAVLRPRADAAQRQGRRRAAHPPLPPGRRDDGVPPGRDVRPAGPRVLDLLTGAGVAVDYRSFPDVGHSMHGERARALCRAPCSSGSAPSTNEDRRSCPLRPR